MARLSTRLLALAYAVSEALALSLRSRLWTARAWRRARVMLDKYGFSGLERFVLDDFLPRHFRVRTHMRLGTPSPAVFRKFRGVVRTPDPASKILTNWGSLRMPARILVIRGDAMGDVLMTTPIVRKLFDDRQGHALIDVATNHPSVFRNNPCVHRTLSPQSLAGQVCDYDLVINLDGVYERNPSCHVIDAYAFHAFGDIDFDKQPELIPIELELERIQSIVAGIGKPYLVMHKPNHHWPSKNLPMRLWQDLIDGILVGWPHAIVQIGSASDAFIGGSDRLLDHRARYSLQELHLLISHSSAFVGVDAGPVHVASATNAPMCVFFTAANHQYLKPLRKGCVFVPIVPNIDCYGCQSSIPVSQRSHFCRRGDNLCVESFNAEDAARNILAVLKDSTH